MQNRSTSFRLYSNPAVVPQNVFDNVILHEVLEIISKMADKFLFTRVKIIMLLQAVNKFFNAC